MSSNRIVPDVYERKMIDVLTPALKCMVNDYFLMHQFKLIGCTREDGFAGQGVIPICEMQRHSVFKTSTELGTYNHHQNVVKWKDEYWCGWDNSMVNEEWPGQRTFISHSKDGIEWSPRILVADGDQEKGMLRNLGGLYVKGDTLYAFIQEKWDIAHATSPGMSTHDNTKVSYRNDIWATKDGTNWKMVKKEYVDTRWMFENPRLTNEGRLMGPTTDRLGRPGVLLWPGDDPLQVPKMIMQPWHGSEALTEAYYEGHDVGRFIYGEATWYADDDNRIWMYWRDESASEYLGLTLSEDGGETWTEVMRSNFPDSMSRTFAGRLHDGRFYQVGNSTRVLMDRNFFAISLSDDGAKFNKMYQLVTKQTKQRFQGHLKCHGYQYPSCLVDGEKLLIVYSVNKEDIECGIVDLKKI
jgi:hypothetical protein